MKISGIQQPTTQSPNFGATIIPRTTYIIEKDIPKLAENLKNNFDKFKPETLEKLCQEGKISKSNTLEETLTELQNGNDSRKLETFFRYLDIIKQSKAFKTFEIRVPHIKFSPTVEIRIDGKLYSSELLLPSAQDRKTANCFNALSNFIKKYFGERVANQAKQPSSREGYNIEAKKKQLEDFKKQIADLQKEHIKELEKITSKDLYSNQYLILHE